MTKLFEVVEGIVIGIILGGITFVILGIVWLFLPENEKGLSGIAVNIMAVGSIIVGPFIGAIYGIICGISTEFFINFLKLILKSTLVVLLCLLIVLVGEWAYAEVRFQLWLGQDERRLDFSAYDTSEELREALLTKLPVGSPEEHVQDFRMANGHSYRKPSKSYESLGVGMTKPQHSSRGFFGLRLFLPGVWIISFELDPNNHRLVDIYVVSHPGP